MTSPGPGTAPDARRELGRLLRGVQALGGTLGEIALELFAPSHAVGIGAVSRLRRFADDGGGRCQVCTQGVHDNAAARAIELLRAAVGGRENVFRQGNGDASEWHGTLSITGYEQDTSREGKREGGWRRGILSKKQYNQAYGDGGTDLTRPIPKLLEYYYKNSSLLFLGCSLNNDRTVQVFRATKQEVGDIDLPQHFAIEQAPETEKALIDRNADLLRLGVTGIWFEKGHFEFVEAMLRLARNELRYRGVFPGMTLSVIEPVSVEPPTASEPSLARRLWSRLFE